MKELREKEEVWERVRVRVDERVGERWAHFAATSQPELNNGKKTLVVESHKFSAEARNVAPRFKMAFLMTRFIQLIFFYCSNELG